MQFHTVFSIPTSTTSPIVKLIRRELALPISVKKIATQRTQIVHPEAKSGSKETNTSTTITTLAMFPTKMTLGT